MSHSKLTTKGQTTIPADVRTALGLEPGSRLEYAIHGDHAVIRLQKGAVALAGILSGGPVNTRGKTFAQIRQAAAEKALPRYRREYGKTSSR